MSFQCIYKDTNLCTVNLLPILSCTFVTGTELRLYEIIIIKKCCLHVLDLVKIIGNFDFTLRTLTVFPLTNAISLFYDPSAIVIFIFHNAHYMNFS